MKTNTQFLQNVLNSWIEKPSFKDCPYNKIENRNEDGTISVQYGLTKEDKIAYLINELNFSSEGIEIESTKEYEIVNLSAIKKNELMNEYAKLGKTDMVMKLALNQGTIKVKQAILFDSATQSAKIDYLENLYRNQFGELPKNVQAPYLGGDNVKELFFIMAHYFGYDLTPRN